MFNQFPSVLLRPTSNSLNSCYNQSKLSIKQKHALDMITQSEKGSGVETRNDCQTKIERTR